MLVPRRRTYACHPRLTPVVLVDIFSFLVGAVHAFARHARAFAISTYDTRASRIVFASTPTATGKRRGPFNTSATTPIQLDDGTHQRAFGLPTYVNSLRPTAIRTRTASERAASACSVSSAGRYTWRTKSGDLIRPRSLRADAYVSGQRNFLTLPFVLGFVRPISPIAAAHSHALRWFGFAPALT